jgi:hypothetical protein
MRWLLIVAFAFCLHNCKQFENVNSNKDQAAIKEVKKQIQELVPCESIGLSYQTTPNSILGDKMAFIYSLKNPEINLKNDSITSIYSKQIESIIRSEMNNLSNFNGFNVIFENRTEVSPSISKQETVTYKFNTSQP